MKGIERRLARLEERKNGIDNLSDDDVARAITLLLKTVSLEPFSTGEEDELQAIRGKYRRLSSSMPDEALNAALERELRILHSPGNLASRLVRCGATHVGGGL